ncbi:alpha/beta hydrolase fold [Sinosporangium album]|uniref:Alpha/beta hydrolase fold n=1 Tax=Sinosporangium album TaxID=504805 RepID=A0A1G8GV77_9ACTN|nr:alpha/beta hydrolase [Sinosporangium album]SDH98325.1 alpha/beta hydrolase fold [Sinosporangium album]
MRFVRPALAALAAAGLFVSGTGCTQGVGRTTTSPAAEPPSAQKLAWRPCGGEFECAKLQVPIDYGKPNGEKIQIAVIRLPASGPNRIGSIVVNPGGPGGSGVQYARAARSVLSDEVRQRFDVVGFDPRGVGESAPVRCLSPRELDAYLSLDNTPDKPEEVKAYEEGAKRFAAGCESESARLLPYVGTVNVARDMDRLREALGDKGLTYLGKSYGTMIGAVYADLFPTKVRALVLDGAVDPSLSSMDVNLTQAKGFETAYRAFLQDCLGHADCPFRGRTVDEAMKELTELLRRTDTTPLRNSSGDGRHITEPWVTLGILTPLYDRRSWPTLRQALSDALRGDGTTLLRMADVLVDRRRDGTYSNQTESNMAVNCVDSPYPTSLSAFTKAAGEAAKAAPHFGPQVMWGSLPCAFWPVPADKRIAHLSAKGAPPILVIGTYRDPATPYSWAQSLAKQLSSGVLLSYDGDGHTAYYTGSSCVDDAVDRYLISLKPPAPGTVCPKVG